MTEWQFFISLIIISVIFAFRNKIVIFINLHLLLKANIKARLHRDYISYLCFISLIAVLIFGVLTGSNNERQFGNVQDGFKNIKPSDKPHPLFDINLDIFR